MKSELGRAVSRQTELTPGSPSTDEAVRGPLHPRPPQCTQNGLGKRPWLGLLPQAGQQRKSKGEKAEKYRTSTRTFWIRTEGAALGACSTEKSNGQKRTKLRCILQSKEPPARANRGSDFRDEMTSAPRPPPVNKKEPGKEFVSDV